MVPLEKLREEANDAKLEVEDLANFIIERLDIQLPPSDDEADS
jgi:hypothetical protein